MGPPRQMVRNLASVVLAGLCARHFFYMCVDYCRGGPVCPPMGFGIMVTITTHLSPTSAFHSVW